MNPAADPVQRGAQADGATAHAGPVRLTGTTRVEAFSDGVLAIAITLLILDIRLPSTGQDSDAPVPLGPTRTSRTPPKAISIPTVIAGQGNPDRNFEAEFEHRLQTLITGLRQQITGRAARSTRRCGP